MSAPISHVDNDKRRGGLASRKVSPWGTWTLDTPNAMRVQAKYKREHPSDAELAGIACRDKRKTHPWRTFDPKPAKDTAV